MYEVESITVEVGQISKPNVTFFRRGEHGKHIAHRMEVSWKSLERLTDWIQNHRYDFVLDEIMSGNGWVHMDFSLG